MNFLGKLKTLTKSRIINTKIIKKYSNVVRNDKMLPSEGLPLVGSLFSFIKSGSSPKLHLYIDDKHKRLGPVFEEVILSRRTIFLSDPDKIREVFSLEGKYPVHFLPESWLLYNRTYNRKRGLLFMEKEEWQHYRRIMNQFLLKENPTDNLKEVYKDIADSLVTQWKGSADSGKSLENVETDMYLHSLSFMLATAVGSSYRHNKQTFQNELERLSTTYQKIFETTSNLMVVPVDLASKLNLSVWRTFVEAMDDALSESERVLSKINKCVSDDGLLKRLADAGISERMTTILLTDLMMAAGDTTAYTMQWALYLLGKHPSIQESARTDEDLIKGAIKETLRLYPAAPFLTRQIRHPLEVSGHRIPADEMIVMSMYTCGRSRSNFPNPNEFRPQRWTRDAEGRIEGVRNKYASLPFAMGARSCVGKKLAEAVMTLTLKAVLSNYRLTCVKDVDMILRLTPAPFSRFQIKVNYR